MLIKVVRKWSKPEYIIGQLFVDDYLFCNTLEPPKNRERYPCIPRGSYPIDIRWSVKFKGYRPFVDAVPGRFGIMIHEGNSVTDTHGCILVGQNYVKGRVLESRAHLRQLMEMLTKAKQRGESIMLQVI